MLHISKLACSECVLSCTGHPRQGFVSLPWCEQTCKHPNKYANMQTDMMLDRFRSSGVEPRATALAAVGP